jgi:hypothetical protein
MLSILTSILLLLCSKKVLSTCSDTIFSVKPKVTCKAFVCLKLCEKGLKHVETNCQGSCGVCNNKAIAIHQSPPSSPPRAPVLAKHNATSYRISWTIPSEKKLECSATHLQWLESSSNKNENTSEQPMSSILAVTKFKLDYSNYKSRKITYVKIRSKNAFGWSQWSQWSLGILSPKSLSTNTKTIKQTSKATNKAKTTNKPKSSPTILKTSSLECVDTLGSSGTYTCAQYAAKKLCSMSFVKKNCCKTCSESVKTQSKSSIPPSKTSTLPKKSPATKILKQPKVVPTKPQAVPTKPQAVPTKPQVVPTKPQVVPTKPKVVPTKTNTKMNAEPKSAPPHQIIAHEVKHPQMKRPKLQILRSPSSRLTETRGICLGGAQTCGNRPLKILGNSGMPALTILTGGTQQN